MGKQGFNKMDAFGLIDYLSSMENNALLRELNLEDALTISNGEIEVAVWNTFLEYHLL